MKKKLIRISTVPISLNVLIEGQLKLLSEHYEVIGLSSPGVELDKVQEREKVRTIAVAMERKISLLKDCVSLISLIIVFIKEKPDIVHSMTPKAGLLSMVAAKLTGVPIRVHTFTGLIFPTATGFKKMVLVAMDKLLAWCATDIIPEGKGVKKDLIQYEITKKDLRVLANGNVNGINIDYFSVNSIKKNRNQVRENLGFTPHDFVFVFVGRIVRDKGINELIDAFKRINNNKTKLLLVGDFEQILNPVSAETLEEINNNLRINFIGFQSDIREFLFASDVFVFPSYREGFPNVVMQAGAMGLPSIVTDINGSNEIIVDGINGKIIPPQNKEALYQMMNYFLSSNGELERMASKAREMITSRYNQQIVWNALLAKYESLLNK